MRMSFILGVVVGATLALGAPVLTSQALENQRIHWAEIELDKTEAPIMDLYEEKRRELWKMRAHEQTSNTEYFCQVMSLNLSLLGEGGLGGRRYKFYKNEAEILIRHTKVKCNT